jgi:hypothetical protein
VACAFGSCKSWPRRHKADGGQEAFRRARPGGGVTKQLQAPRPCDSSFSSAFQAEEKEERVVWRAPSVAASLGPAGIKPTEAKCR